MCVPKLKVVQFPQSVGCGLRGTQLVKVFRIEKCVHLWHECTDVREEFHGVQVNGFISADSAPALGLIHGQAATVPRAALISRTLVLLLPLVDPGN